MLILKAVGDLCLVVSPGRWGPDPHMCQVFTIQNRRSFPIGKTNSRDGSTSHVPSETYTHRPPTALTLGSEDAQLSGA